VVTGQMIADLVVLGLAVKTIVSAMRRGQQSKSPHQDQGARRTR
jgi:hypothetical protein